MKRMNIGSVIAKRRKEKGVTQEELAEYLGVSKPAVSKWESGQSYPDIMLLPVIASYFNISIDELLSYEAQMTSDDIKKVYLKLADDFSREPFDKVYTQCKEYIKSYYSCWDLLFSMAQLLLNHAPLSGSPERANDIFKEVADIYKRIEEESSNTVLSRQALTLRAYCYLALQQPIDAIDLLDGIEEAEISSEIVLAKAYMLKGDLQKSKSISQIFIYKNLLNLFSAFPDLMYYYSDNQEKMDECLQKALSLGDVFGLKEMHPALYFSTYFTAATLFAMQNQNDKALKSLEDYTDLLTKDGIFPLRLHGNKFFDLIDSYFESLNLGTFPPRSEKLILKDIKSTITENPAFQGLKSDKRFDVIVKKLENLEEKSHE